MDNKDVETMEVKRSLLIENFKGLINFIPEEDICRQGLIETPKRAAKAFEYLTEGYSQSSEDFINNAIFDTEGADELVLVKDIEYYSLCEHHLLPFFGVVHVGYIPDEKIIGLSKIPRIVDMFSKRLQIQEKLTQQIADELQNLIKPLGVGVAIEGQHLCMCMRGVQKQNAVMKTNSLLGVFKTEDSARAEFLSTIYG